MRKSSCIFLPALVFLVAGVLRAQQPCPGYSVVVNTAEDQLMLDINGAENPQDQIAALDKYAQAHPDSKFMPCVNEYYTSTYVKLKDYDKAIEYGEKDLAADYFDLNLALNLLRAYVASGKTGDSAFEAIFKIPDEIKKEISPSRPSKMSDEEWEKMQKDAAEQAKDHRAYAVYAFFQLLPRVTDGAKRVEYLDKFQQIFPGAATEYAAQINNGYFEAYRLSNQVDKMLEYGEKTVEADPNNLVVLNTLAFVYGVVNRSNMEKADAYAGKAVKVAEEMKKPEGVSDEDFKKEQNNQLGMAHLTLGYVDFAKAGKSRKVATAIKELKTAADLLDANPPLQAQALFYLGNAYEFEYPANHGAALEALRKAAELPGPFQGPAKELIEKIRRAGGR